MVSILPFGGKRMSDSLKGTSVSYAVLQAPQLHPWWIATWYPQLYISQSTQRQAEEPAFSGPLLAIQGFTFLGFKISIFKAKRMAHELCKELCQELCKVLGGSKVTWLLDSDTLMFVHQKQGGWKGWSKWEAAKEQATAQPFWFSDRVAITFMMGTNRGPILEVVLLGKPRCGLPLYVSEAYTRYSRHMFICQNLQGTRN
jgi:hypothetical protein